MAEWIGELMAGWSTGVVLLVVLAVVIVAIIYFYYESSAGLMDMGKLTKRGKKKHGKK